MNRRFLIPSLLAAGFAPSSAPASGLVSAEFDTDAADGNDLEWRQVLTLQRIYMLAQHRSHRSHGSHQSHRSSSGGRRSSPPPSSAPPPDNNSTPPGSVLPESPATAPGTILPGNSEKFKLIIRRLQAALYAQGYYTGAIDGIVGAETRAAIAMYERRSGWPVTGTVTRKLLDALNIPEE